MNERSTAHGSLPMTELVSLIGGALVASSAVAADTPVPVL
jgi:hypothetical protein